MKRRTLLLIPFVVASFDWFVAQNLQDGVCDVFFLTNLGHRSTCQTPFLI